SEEPSGGSSQGGSLPGVSDDQDAATPPFQWTDAARALVRDHFGAKDHRVLAREVGCTVDELRVEARRLYADVTPDRTGPWAAEELTSLKRYLGVVEVDLIARMIGRTEASIQQKLVELAAELTPEALETRFHVEFKRLYGTRADEDLALIFGRQLGVIQALAAELCLSKDKGFMRRKAGTGAPRTKMPRWSAAELDQLREIYPQQSNLEIAKALGRSVKSIVSKAHSLRLKKDKARLRQMGQENVQLRQDR
ncbi:MAG: hypothetical protein AAGG01_22200, partial [Planctomycetota bacterium]